MDLFDDLPLPPEAAHTPIAPGVALLAYHGVLPLADGEHALLGRRRINLTFRRAG
jgi:alkylated DNA repair protein (DNA oxidative demethylase)